MNYLSFHYFVWETHFDMQVLWTESVSGPNHTHKPSIHSAPPCTHFPQPHLPLAVDDSHGPRSQATPASKN